MSTSTRGLGTSSPASAPARSCPQRSSSARRRGDGASCPRPVRALAGAGAGSPHAHRGGAYSARVARRGLHVVEQDPSIGGGLLAGALAYRLFVLLLPSALLFVSGLGLYAGAVDKPPRTVARDAGLHGLIASEI